MDWIKYFLIVFFFFFSDIINGNKNGTMNMSKQQRITMLVELLENEDAEVSKRTLNELPLAVLDQMNVTNPMTLILCPEAHVPFDLETCTKGVIDTAPLKGTCSDPNSNYDEENLQCLVLTRAEPFVSCPQGFGWTRLPFNIPRGSCHRSEKIEAVPQCDTPYILSEDREDCVLREATLGDIGCHPGEVVSGNLCISAKQIAPNIRCPLNFTKEIMPSGIHCIKETVVRGTWSTYAERPVCPTGYRSSVSRALKKKKKNEASLSNETFTADHQNHLYHEPLETLLPNVSCIKTIHKSPELVDCPPGSINYTKFLRESKEQPIVELLQTPLEPRLSCVRIQNFSKVPTCQSRHSTIYLDNVKGLTEVLKIHRKMDHTIQYNDSFSYRDNVYDGIPYGWSNKTFRFLKTRKDSRQWWPSQQNVIELLPTSSTIYPLSNTSIAKQNNSFRNDTRLYSQLNTTYASALFKNMSTHNPPEFGDSLIVDWTKLYSMKNIQDELKRFNLTIHDIDWVTLLKHNKFGVICETKTTAAIHWMCPEKFRLRRDGMCIGTDYSTFLLMCPEGYTLDDTYLARSMEKNPKPRCVGNTTVSPTYTCGEFTSKSQSNVDLETTKYKHPTTLQMNKTHNVPLYSGDTNFSIQYSVDQENVLKQQQRNQTQAEKKKNPSYLISPWIVKSNDTDTFSWFYNASPTLPSLHSFFPESKQINTSTEEFRDAKKKKCYRVFRRVNAIFSPNYTVIKNLYGKDTATSFFDQIGYGKLHNTSPFLDL